MIATFDGATVHFASTVPVGADGLTGATGEVSAQQLLDGINGTSPNTNGVPTLAPPSPTQTWTSCARSSMS